MNGHWWARVLAILGVVAVVGVIAAFAFQARSAHPYAAGGTMMYGHSGYMGYGGGGLFAGFFLFRLLFGLLVLFLIFRLVRFAIFGPGHWGTWHGDHRMHAHGPMHGGPGWDGRREMFEDWHRTAHAGEAQAPSAPPAVAPAGGEQRS